LRASVRRHRRTQGMPAMLTLWEAPSPEARHGA
jgi:hypothetical protein